MILHRWGLIDYPRARERMEAVHVRALAEGRDHLIFCSHPPCFTVGSEGGRWDLPTLSADRGGSITCHAPGQLIAYFCFHVPQPARFYTRILWAYEALFAQLLPQAYYDRARPGFYVQRRKIASLGFRYRQGVSLHGVALNVDPDLKFCNRVAPCNLEGVRAGSLHDEGVWVSMEEVQARLLQAIAHSFGRELPALAEETVAGMRGEVRDV